jgi:hypothetical protein
MIVSSRPSSRYSQGDSLLADTVSDRISVVLIVAGVVLALVLLVGLLFLAMEGLGRLSNFIDTHRGAVFGAIVCVGVVSYLIVGTTAGVSAGVVAIVALLVMALQDLP